VNLFGEKNGKAMMHATAGRYATKCAFFYAKAECRNCSFIGVGEIVLLPLDVLKIKRQ
jgi:hypothetical protein